MIVRDENSVAIKVRFNVPRNLTIRLTDFRLTRERIIQAKFHPATVIAYFQ